MAAEKLRLEEFKIVSRLVPDLDCAVRGLRLAGAEADDGLSLSA